MVTTKGELVTTKNDLAMLVGKLDDVLTKMQQQDKTLGDRMQQTMEAADQTVTRNNQAIEVKFGTFETGANALEGKIQRIETIVQGIH